MNTKTNPFLHLEPRGLNRSQAAAYIGVGTTKFDELVANGAMPTAKEIGKRRLWDRRALDSAFDDLPDSGSSEWDEALGL